MLIFPAGKSGKCKHIMLLGAFGHSNLGDDLLLLCFLNLLRPFAKHIWCSAADLSLVPHVVKENPDITLFPTYSEWLSKLRVFARSDMIILGGGSVMKELYKTMGRWKYGPLVWMLCLALLSRLAGKKFYALGIGVGPLPSYLGKKLASWILRRMDLVVVRDSKSYEVVRSLLPIHHRTELVLGVDISFLCPWPHDQRTKFSPSILQLRKLKHEGAMLIGMNAVYNVKDQADPRLIAHTLANFINRALRMVPCSWIVFFPFQTAYNPNHDLVYFTRDILPRVAPRYRSRCILLEDLNVSTVLDHLVHVDLFVGMRLHALVACVRAGIPFLALLYDEKCNSFVTDIRYPYVLDVQTCTEDALLELMQVIMERADGIHTMLKIRCEQLMEKAKEEMLLVIKRHLNAD